MKDFVLTSLYYAHIKSILLTLSVHYLITIFTLISGEIVDKQWTRYGLGMAMIWT